MVCCASRRIKCEEFEQNYEFLEDQAAKREREIAALKEAEEAAKHAQAVQIAAAAEVAAGRFSEPVVAVS